MGGPHRGRASTRCLMFAIGTIAGCQDPARPAGSDPADLSVSGVSAIEVGESAEPPARATRDSFTIAHVPVRIRELALANATPIEIDGAPDAATVVLGNSSGGTLARFYWFLDIRQDTNWVQTGWGWVDCGAGVGVVPPGRCALPRLPFTAAHSGRRIGTLVPGPATLTYELWHQRGDGARASARSSIPVMLVAASVSQVLVTPANYTYFGSPPVGTIVPLTALVVPATAPQQVTWTSSQPQVATVDARGVVTLQGAGSTLIVATSTVDATRQGSSLFALDAPPASGNGVNVSPGVWYALRGMSTRLTAQVLSGPLAVGWTSVVPSVATVDAQGNVVATASGPFAIRATSTFDPSRTATTTGEVLDYDWRTPTTPTSVSTGGTLPAANPLSVPLGVEACGSLNVYGAPYVLAEWQRQVGEGWVSVGSTSLVSAVDHIGVRRCWWATITWTPGTAVGTGPQSLRTILHGRYGSQVVTTVNGLVTITDP